jgi:hypothetical protein
VSLFRPWIWPRVGRWDRRRLPSRQGLPPPAARTRFPQATALAFPARQPLFAQKAGSCQVLRILEPRSAGDRAAGAPRKCASFRTGILRDK